MVALAAAERPVCAQAAPGSEVSPPEVAPPIDEAQAAALGIRRLRGEHLVLYTDLPESPELDALPAIFAAAVPQWAAYFGIERAELDDWQVRAFLIGDRQPFDALGVMPEGRNGEFPHGLSVGGDLWLYDQPTAYYRRHLLLHEGTHAFMQRWLGDCGPGWYMEGMAELLATHRLREDTSDASLEINVMPRNRREVPMLGRIRLIREARAAGQCRSLAEVMQTDAQRRLGNEDYAWCWAAAKWLDAHPRYRERFRTLGQHVGDPEFNRHVRRTFADDWHELRAEWRAFVAALEHGYDFESMAIDFDPGTSLAGQPREVTIRADRGWQSSGVRLEAGRNYRIAGGGRYQIAAQQTDAGVRRWPCEAGGVTIEYHDGRPLGMLLGALCPGALRPEQTARDVAGFAEPIAIGLQRSFTPAASGTLYLRVNDRASRLDDNRGTLTVVIEEADDG